MRSDASARSWSDFRLILEWNSRMALRSWPTIATGIIDSLVLYMAFVVGVATTAHIISGFDNLAAYQHFATPGVLAVSAAMVGTVELVANVYDKARVSRVYQSIGSTPIATPAIVLGEVSWMFLRLALYQSVIVMFAMATQSSPEVGDLVVAGAVNALLLLLTSPGLLLLACRARDWRHVEMIIALVGFQVLLSGAIYPVDLLPTPLRVISALLPVRGLVAVAQLGRGASLLDVVGLGVAVAWSLAMSTKMIGAFDGLLGRNS